jgi:GTP-binding protein EngB required for normal cell division
MPDTEYTTILKHFEKVFEAYRNVVPYLSKEHLPDHFKSSVRDKESWINRLNSPEFPVAFLGSFNTGKSTVINAIIGRNLLPEAAESKTAIPTHVKKGEKDYAVIHYLGETERQELRNLYIEEISKGLAKNREDISQLVELDDQKLIDTLQSDIAEVVKTSNTPFNKGKFFDELKTLITKGNAFKGETKDITLSDLPKYVTENRENRDILFIDKVEVFLSETNLSEEGIVLVDLPGLGVVNPRHKKITQSYMEKDAKAFVITTIVLKLLEGDEIDLLDEIHQQRPDVLQKAFWVINQWDTAGEQQRKEANNHFEAKLNEHQFEINRDRIFRVTAWNYLLLKLISEDKLKGSRLEGYLDVLKRFVGEVPSSEKAKALINSIDEVSDFVKLKNDLLAYLGTTAKNEFLDEAKRACRNLSDKLLDKLRPHYKEPSEGEESFKDFLLRRETEKRAAKILKDVHKIVTKTILKRAIQTVCSPEFVFWTDETQQEFETKVIGALNELNRQEIQDDLIESLDIKQNLAILPQKLEERLSISKLFRENVQSLMQEKVIHAFSHQLLDDLKDSNSLPDEILNQLNDKLGDRDLIARAKGHCDILLSGYGDTLQSLGTEMAQQSFSDNKKRDKVIEEALGLHGKKMIEFVRNKQTDVNEHTKMGIKNYFEELAKVLLELFEEKQFDIAEDIRRRVTSNLEEELGPELKKQAAINKAYKTLADVRTGCQ